MPGKGAEGGAFVDDKKGKDCKGGRMEGWKGGILPVLAILEKPSFQDPMGGATNATQKNRFLITLHISSPRNWEKIRT